MTRSEALEDVHFYRQRGTEYLHVKDVSIFALLHKIYDDFEEQLDMEKRTAWTDGSNANFEALKKAGKLK